MKISNSCDIYDNHKSLTTYIDLHYLQTNQDHNDTRHCLNK
jgi:hypothetical protein